MQLVRDYTILAVGRSVSCLISGKHGACCSSATSVSLHFSEAPDPECEAPVYGVRLQNTPSQCLSVLAAAELTLEMPSEQQQGLDMNERKDIDAQVLVEDDDAKLRSLGITPVLDRSVLLVLTASAVVAACTAPVQFM